MVGKIVNEDELAIKHFKTPRIITYPRDGTIKTGVASGLWKFYFNNGAVLKPDGSDDFMSNNLEKIKDKRCRSALIFVSDARAKITIGATEVLLSGTQNYYVAEGIEFQSISIDLPTDAIPKDDFGLLVIGSTSPIFPLTIEKLISEYTPSKITAPTSADAFATIFQGCMAGYDQVNGIFRNVGGANTLTLQVGYSTDGIFFNFDPAQNVLPLASTRITVTSKWKFIQIQMKNTSAGLASTYELYSRLVR